MARRIGHSGLVIASNRLPVRLTVGGGKFDVQPSSGGLASALGAMRGDAAWIGWPGTVVPTSLRDKVEKRLARGQPLPRLSLAGGGGGLLRPDLQRHALAALPLLHRAAPLHAARRGSRYVDGERALRRRRSPEHCAPGRARLGARLPSDARPGDAPPALGRTSSIGFFLHIPFPSSEIYRLLPAREQILRGVLGADYIGFQTGDYARHFRSSCLRMLGLDSEPDSIELDGRRDRHRRPPDRDRRRGRSARRLADPETARRSRRARAAVRGPQARPRRRAARLHEGDPAEARTRSSASSSRTRSGRETTTMLQVLVPSRLESPEYSAQRDEIELPHRARQRAVRAARRTPRSSTCTATSRSPELVALYRRADVMMVTPLRDGMNLVAQEFVLCQAEPGLPSRWRGALLLLSEFAGAAQVLPGALLVNPWDVDGVVEHARDGAGARPARERRRRLETMAKRVEALDCRRWAEGYLGRLGRYSRRTTRRGRPATARRDRRGADQPSLRRAPVRARSSSTTTARSASSRRTRTSPRRRPRSAASSASWRRCPRNRRPHRQRPHAGTLSSSGSASSRSISAPSTATSRAHPAASGATLVDVDLSLASARSSGSSRKVAEDVPGTLVERKSCSVAWHYRQAEPEYGAWRAHELLIDLEPAPRRRAGGDPPRAPRVEVRARGVNKGVYVKSLFPDGKESSHFVIAARRRPDRSRPPRRAAVGVGRGPRGRAPPERALRRRPARAHPRRRARGGARVPARPRDGVRGAARRRRGSPA